jgi:uncharacterized protein YecE (DUF72 family)
MKVYIGTSGWQYYHWKGKFYPENLTSKDFLKFYSRYFNTVEVNTSFYHFTKKETFEKWKTQIYADFERINTDFKLIKNHKNNPHNSVLYTNKPVTENVPHTSVSNPHKSAGFLFSIKFNRLFTHFRKLKLNKEDVKILKDTLDSYKILGKHLGVILIQLSPSLKKDLKLLNNFVNKLRKYSSIKNLKLAIEFRHKSWLDKEVYKKLKKLKVAFCISDSPRWPTDFVKTTDFVYVRFHGKPKLFASRYSEKELEEFSEKLKKLKPKTLFIYFNNDFEGYAVENALYMQKLF